MSLTLKAKALVEAAAFDGFGQAAPIRKQREWKTEVVPFDNQTEQTQQIWDEPRRHFYINWSLLDLAGRNKVIEIFDAARGRFDTILWLDDDEYQCSGEQIATDGTTLAYQLQCTYYPGESYEWTETKKDIVAGDIYAPVVTHNVDGPQTEVAAAPGANEFTLDDTTGILTWSAGNALPAGILTVSFQYYFRVRFAEDTYESIQQYAQLYSQSELHVYEVKPWVQ
jgi:uncharacterized protein (TIGR02217 family)